MDVSNSNNGQSVNSAQTVLVQGQQVPVSEMEKCFTKVDSVWVQSDQLKSHGQPDNNGWNNREIRLENGIVIEYNSVSSSCPYSDAVVFLDKEGNTVIENFGGLPDNKIIGTDGDDKIMAFGSRHFSIDSGDGNDEISVTNCFAANIDTGKGIDAVSVYDSNAVKVNTGEDADVVFTSESFSKINSGDGDDIIDLFSSPGSTVIAGAGDDVIHCIDSWDSAISAGDGDDIIGMARSSSSYIDPGSGSNLIATTKSKSLVIEPSSEDTSVVNIDIEDEQ